MASQNVKGLNIKLSADTTAINKSLSDVNKSLTSTQKELTQVDKLLKFDPQNTILLAQKQSLLSDAINNTKLKLEQLQKVKQLADKDTGVDKTSKQYRDLERQLEQTKRKLEDYNKESRNVGNALDDATSGASNFKSTLEALVSSNFITAGLQLLYKLVSGIFGAVKGAIGGMVDLVKQGVEYNAKMETYSTSIRAILDGDEKATQKLIKSMKQLSSQSGYASDTLLEGARNLLSADISAEETTKTIEAMSRALYGVGASNDDLSRMITNLQGIASTGKATAQDLKQFKNIGVNVSKLVAEATGKTVEQVEKAGITFNDLSNAFIKASEEGGRYATVFEDLSGTFQAQANSIKSNWETLLGDISLDTTSALSTKILPSINELLEAMTSGFEEDGMEGVKQAFSENFANVINTLSDEGTIEQLLSGISNIVDTIESAFDPSTEQGQKNQEALSNAVDKLLGIIDKLIDLAYDKIKSIGSKIGGAIIEGIWDSLSRVEFNDDWQQRINGITWNSSMGSGGFGNLPTIQSGGYNRSITLNANFNVSGQLDESRALMLADIMSDRINNNLGNEL